MTLIFFWGGGGGEEVRWKTVRTYGKILATPLVPPYKGRLSYNLALALQLSTKKENNKLKHRVQCIL